MESEKSCTQVLIDVMEDFGSAEAQKVLVIYMDSEDFVRWRSNHLSEHEKIGLMEVVKAAILKLMNHPEPID